MRIVMYLATVFGGLVFTTGLLAWVLAASSAQSPGSVLLVALAPAAFVAAAWLLGTSQIRAPQPGTEGPPGTAGRRPWWLRSGGVLWVIGAIATLVQPLASGGPLSIVVVLLGSGALLAAAGFGAGWWVRARRREDPESGQLRMPTAEALLTPMASLVAVGSQAVFWISLLAGSPTRPTGGTGELFYHLLGSTQLALYAAGVAAMICGLYLRDQLLHDARVNRDQVGMLRRVIRGSLSLPREPEIRRQALRYAVVIPYQLFFYLLFLPLLFLAQSLQYYVGVIRGEGSVFGQLTSVVLAVALVLVSVHFLRLRRAARHFARDQLAGPSVGCTQG